MRETIILAGALAQRPRRGGHAWVFLQYLLGFRRLGWDVLFVDRLDRDMCVDETGRATGVASSVNLRFLSDLMERFDLADNWALLHDGEENVVGTSREELVERARRCAVLVNVMGYLDDEELLAAAPLRVFLDIDPGFGQMWHELGLADLFKGHDRYVTVGLGIGTPACAVPTCDLDWITTLPPVELSRWPPMTDRGERFTSVVSWRGPFGPIEFEGRTYGLRVHEFRRFIELPALSPARFEVALDIHEADAPDRRQLEQHGWRLTDPLSVAADPWRYRDYVQGSEAELMIAKNLYVDTHSGWFSDRSACYLASGRPVLAQDTGLDGLLPHGDGLVTFSTLEEAVAGSEAISRDYKRHSRAARAIASEHFAAERVLPRLLDLLGVG